MQSTFDKWHKTTSGYLVMALVELIVAYLSASWAIDTANPFAYLLTVVFVIGWLRNLVLGVRGIIHDSQRGKAKKA